MDRDDRTSAGAVATRAIKLRIVVPRSSREDATSVRRALWRTHAATNDAVRNYEQLLLEMRQADVCLVDEDGDEVVRSGDKWAADLAVRLGERRVPKRHQRAAMTELAALYGLMVRSCDDPGKGSANDANACLSPLCAQSSAGGERRLEALEQFGWMIEKEKPPRGWQRRLASQVEADPSLAKPTGAPPRWVTLRRAADPSWPDALLEMVEKKKAEGPSALRRLRELRALPLIDPFIALAGSRGVVNPHERGALALAAGHLLSWESWRHNLVHERQRLEAEVARADERAEAFGSAVEELRRYEKDREKHIREVSTSWTEDSAYRLTQREVRGWGRLREWLRKHPEADGAARLEHVRGLQAKLEGRFGGAEVMRWLAEPEQQHLADHPAGDPVTWLAARNALGTRLARKRGLPTFTFADAVKHPRYVEMDCPANSNKPRYYLRADGDQLLVDLPLLHAVPEGGYEERRHTLRLAASGQLREVKLTEGARKQQHLSFLSQDGLDHIVASAGGAALILDRGALKDAERHAAGHYGPVYLKLAVNYPVDDKLARSRRKVATHLSRAAVSRKAKDRPEGLVAGTRILAVDLGIRSAAACTVFQLDGDDKGSPWGNAEGLSIHHERSFLLTLPGERPERGERERRAAATAALREASSILRLLGDVRRLVDEQDHERRAQRSEDLRPRLEEVGELYATSLRGLPRAHDLADEDWLAAAEPLHLALETLAGKRIGELRRQQRATHDPVRPFDRLGGKSMFQLDYLERTRRLLLGWDRHSRPGQPVRRLDRSRQGVVARRLLKHINRLKDDRTRTTADLIVQAARGRAYVHEQWQDRFAPVDVIVMEDLSQYRFRTDRPPRENSQLMLWSHRAVSETVQMQAEVASIAVADTGAAFSSRYDALTGAPGIRCRAVTEYDVRGLRERREPLWMYRRLLDAGLTDDEVERLRAGALMPTGDGETLVTLTREGILRRIHADINAAQNVGHRFLTGHARSVRFVAWEPPGGDGSRLVNRSLGKRLRGPLGGSAVLLEAVDDAHTMFAAQAFATEKKLARSLCTDVDDLEHEDDEHGAEGDTAEALLDVLAQSAARRKVLHRDPSGIFFSPDRWVVGERFWGQVGTRIRSALRAARWGLPS